MTTEQPAGPPPAERRAVPRLEAVDQSARLAWRGNGRTMAKVRARLVDISGKGAQVVSATRLPQDGPIWLGLESLVGEWVRARIRTVRAEPGGVVVHLAFDEPCPVGLLDQATTGPDEVALRWEDPGLVLHLDFDWFPAA